METLTAVVRSEYFPAGAVLVGVVLFWTIGVLGGLSWLSGGQPPLAILTWMIFIYGVVVLSPLAGIWAAVDLVRRWCRNRQARQQQPGTADVESL
ncbi:hypothetical protein [Arthrobacter sp. FW306-04-A]|uniref:hypothetical protein n=1 Tax=Arthrobacter sp. FW306-04-A TaxID=2879619 RepID=UPI0037BE4EE9|nr:hypothetical protein LFT43_17510 [Arthrobacter sp. FW306-04-A]